MGGMIMKRPEDAPPETTIPGSGVDDALYDGVVNALHTVYDPEIPVNIWELGLVYSVDVAPGGVIAIQMTLTAPNCPVAGEMPEQVRQTVLAVEGVTACTVDLVWEPPWDPSRMTDEAKVQLDMFY